MYLLTEPWSTFWVFTSSSLLVAASNPLKSVPRVETGSVSACKQLNHNMKSTRNTTKKMSFKSQWKRHIYIFFFVIHSSAKWGWPFASWNGCARMSSLPSAFLTLGLWPRTQALGRRHCACAAMAHWRIHQGYTRVLTIERWCWSFPLLMPGVSVGHGQAARLSSIDLVPYFNICMEPRAWWIHSIMDSWVWTCHERKYNAKRST